jgi:hypothetical protein
MSFASKSSGYNSSLVPGGAEKYHVGIVPGLVRFKTKLVPVKLQGLFHVYDSKADAGYFVHVLLHGIGK